MDALLKPRPRGVQFVRGYPGRWVNLSRLGREATPEGKRALWNDLRAARPALAELLQDPVLRELQQDFNGEIFVEEWRS